jgi:hypothetical protein
MSRKKFAVCGCSFSSKSPKKQYYGKHFSEILTNRIGWDLLSFAYHGCSNGGIRMQIQGAIEAKADFVLVIPTFFDRIEIPISGLKPDLNLHWLAFDHKMKEPLGYDPRKGMKNINYLENSNPSLICENLVSLINNWNHTHRHGRPLSSEIITALKNYVTYLYDPMWKKQQDQWIIEQGMLSLVNKNISCFLIPTISLWHRMPTGPEILSPYYYSLDTDLCPFEISLKEEYSVAKDEWKYDPGFHTTVEAQEVLAERYIKILVDKGII